jgi:hypothetical protein
MAHGVLVCIAVVVNVRSDMGLLGAVLQTRRHGMDGDSSGLFSHGCGGMGVWIGRRASGGFYNKFKVAILGVGI